MADNTARRTATPEEIAEIKKKLASLQKQQEARKSYQKRRNARPEAKAARTAYNRKRYQQNKALMARAKELGLLDSKSESK